ncbi:hypothetical protein [Anaerocolumna xylanovorans]|uniref:Major facilitator superfamily (MFS) profile domain-containing protein n=1 Tax=Anaerocolumna xylanovorans DSM 12503 TaxID=1121345 RepID=A0A1M7YGX8_9FIRM|nr:hypothetical protein [Anaerocolumna xylanovorans]SHO51819.1 hypothetical protein SAMN02745217_03354 [Anaerocolumna xylanovorans DSM 12503]
MAEGRHRAKTLSILGAFTSPAAALAFAIGPLLRGTGNGIFNSFQYIGSFAGAVVTGAVWGVSERLSWLLLIGVSCIGIFLAAVDTKKNSFQKAKV